MWRRTSHARRVGARSLLCSLLHLCTRPRHSPRTARSAHTSSTAAPSPPLPLSASSARGAGACVSVLACARRSGSLCCRRCRCHRLPWSPLPRLAALRSPLCTRALVTLDRCSASFLVAPRRRRGRASRSRFRASPRRRVALSRLLGSTAFSLGGRIPSLPPRTPVPPAVFICLRKEEPHGCAFTSNTKRAPSSSSSSQRAAVSMCGSVLTRTQSDPHVCPRGASPPPPSFPRPFLRSPALKHSHPSVRSTRSAPRPPARSLTIRVCWTSSRTSPASEAGSTAQVCVCVGYTATRNVSEQDERREEAPAAAVTRGVHGGRALGGALALALGTHTCAAPSTCFPPFFSQSSCS